MRCCPSQRQKNRNTMIWLQTEQIWKYPSQQHKAENQYLTMVPSHCQLLSGARTELFPKWTKPGITEIKAQTHWFLTRRRGIQPIMLTALKWDVCSLTRVAFWMEPIFVFKTKCGCNLPASLKPIEYINHIRESKDTFGLNHARTHTHTHTHTEHFIPLSLFPRYNDRLHIKDTIFFLWMKEVENSMWQRKIAGSQNSIFLVGWEG